MRKFHNSELVWIDQQNVVVAAQTTPQEGEEGDVLTAQQSPQLAPPPMYRVVVLNDDYTPMEFVVEILTLFFGLSEEQATQVMMQVHVQGRASVGWYTRDVAETKAMQVIEYAQKNQHPLMCRVERA